MTRPDPVPSASDRPTQPLPLTQLLRLSVYWLGLIAVVTGIGVILQERIKDLVPDPTVQYTTLGVVQAAGRVHRGPRPADGRLDQRLHDQPVRPAQAVHPGRHRCSMCCSSSGSRLRTRCWRSGPSWSCSSSARTSRRGRSRATCPTSSRPCRSGWRAASSACSPCSASSSARGSRRSASRRAISPSPRSPSASSSSSRCSRCSSGSTRGARPRTGPAAVGRRSRWRRGPATSSRNAASCSSSPRASSSSVVARS